MKNVAVIFGGTSVEHDISILTGVMILNSIDKSQFNAIPVYIDKEGVFYTGENLFDIDFYKNLDVKSLKPITFIGGQNAFYYIKRSKLKRGESLAVALNCTHGEYGEDGSVSALMKLCGISLASPSILCSALSIDKHVCKYALRGIGVKTLASYRVKSLQDFFDLEKSQTLKYPIIVKPNSGGSSIGISKAKTKEDAPLAILNALKYGESAQIERALNDFIEINCSAYRDSNGKVIVSLCERPIKSANILTFEDKYQGGQREFPANVEEEISKKIQSITKKVYECFDFEGIIRIDFMVTENEVYLNEINGVPGSLAYYLHTNTLKEFSKVLTEVLKGAISRDLYKTNVIKKFDTKVLFGFGSKGSKHLKKE